LAEIILAGPVTAVVYPLLLDIIPPGFRNRLSCGYVFSLKNQDQIAENKNPNNLVDFVSPAYVCFSEALF
jgi:hypothetical protein